MRAFVSISFYGITIYSLNLLYSRYVLREPLEWWTLHTCYAIENHNKIFSNTFECLYGYLYHQKCFSKCAYCWPSVVQKALIKCSLKLILVFILPWDYFCHYHTIQWLCMLTHWGRDKMAAVSQTTPSNAFSWMKMLEFRLIFRWSLFLRVQLTIIQHWFR